MFLEIHPLPFGYAILFDCMTKNVQTKEIPFPDSMHNVTKANDQITF
jgi:hypothetical protein